MEDRFTKLLLAGLDKWLLSDSVAESLETLVVETGLTMELLLGAAMVV